MSKRDDEIRNFVRKHFDFLVSGFDNGTFDKEKRYYFGEKLKYQFSIPRDREIAIDFIKTYILAKKVSELSRLKEFILENKFLKDKGIDEKDFEPFINDISRKTKIIQDAEKENLDHAHKVEKFVEHIAEVKTADISEKIEAKKKEYDDLPSVLDLSDPKEPEVEDLLEETREWWEILNLRGNPFPSYQGFTSISGDFYKSIVVETDPIKWLTAEFAKDDVQLFGNAYLLAGDFGEGKTTVYDYLSHIVSLKHVEPIIINMPLQRNAKEYTQHFIRRLGAKISKLAQKFDVGFSENKYDLTETILLMDELQSKKSVKGFVIFIDELHKHTDNEYNVFEFLSNLQSIKNEFNSEKISIFFMVSGFRSWMTRIKSDTRLRGFFDDYERLNLPKASPDLAKEIIQKRFKAFSINPDKEINVKDTFFETIFAQVKQNPSFASKGFRLYIDEILSSFKSKRFDILSVNVAALEPSVKTAIKSVMEQNEMFRVAINKLIFGGGIQKKENRERALRILCKVFVDKYVEDDSSDSFFNENRFSLKQLKNASLIVKGQRNGKLFWSPNPFLLDLNKEIFKRHSVSLENYLVQVYSEIGGKNLPELDKDSKGNPFEILEADISIWEAKLESNILTLLKESLNIYKAVVVPSFSSGVDISDANIDSIKKCIWNLVRSILKFESPLILDIYGESSTRNLGFKYNKFESTEQFFALQNEHKEKNDKARLMTFAKDSFEELWAEFKYNIDFSESLNIKMVELPHCFLENYSKNRSALLANVHRGEEYFKALTDYVDVLEDLVREYLFLSSFLVFGPRERRFQYYPDFLKAYMKKNISGSNYETSNEFQNLNRGQYRLLFTSPDKNSPFYKQIIYPISKKWQSHNLESFFHMFGELNIDTDHRKKDFITKHEKAFKEFMSSSSRFTSDLFERIQDLIVSSNSLVIGNGKTSVCFGLYERKNDQVLREYDLQKLQGADSYYFQHDISDMLREYSTEDVMLEKVNDIGAESPLMCVDILNYEFLRTKFNSNYSKAISLIAYYILKGKISSYFIYADRLILRKAGWGERPRP